MLVRWNERPMPRPQRSCGAMPVISRSLKRTLPASALRCPVMRLKSVVLPAPLGPMMALIEPRGTLKLTRVTAWKPPKLLLRSRTSSNLSPPSETARRRLQCARDAAGEDEEQHDKDGAEDERPVLRVGNDLLVQPDENESAEGGADEGAHAAEERPDQDLGRRRPARELGADATVEDAEEPPRESREDAGDDKGRQHVAPHVDPDQCRALAVSPELRQ